MYSKDRGEFGAKISSVLLGLQDAAVIVSDDGKHLGYVGIDKFNVVDALTGLDGEANLFTLPTDFRSVGISVLTSLGFTAELQAVMFANFISNYTKEQRDEYVAVYDALDKNDPSAVQAFVQNMVQMLT